MRKLFAITIIMLMFALYYAYPVTAPTSGKDYQAERTSYWLKVKMTSEREFQVTQRVHVVNDGEAPLKALTFQVFPRAFSQTGTSPVAAGSYPSGWSAGNLVVKEVSVDNQQVSPVLEGVLMSIPLKQQLVSGTSVVVQLDYTVKVPELDYRFGRFGDIISLGDWYPILTRQGRAVSAYPQVGDPGISSTADYQVEMTVPDDYLVAATGVLQEEESKLTGQKTLHFSAVSVRSFALVVGKGLKLQRGTADGAEVEYYHVSSRYADEVTDTVRRAVDYFSEKFGAYPYKKITVAETYLTPFQGVEYPGLVMLSRQVTGNLDIMQRVLVHEVAHQWWYAVVGNDQVREPWLDEALATYAAKLFIEEELGREFRFDEGLYESAQEGRINFLSPVTAFDSRSDYLSHVYYGGAMFWVTLEKQVGRQRLLDFLSRIYRDYSFREITTAQMQQEIIQLTKE